MNTPRKSAPKVRDGKVQKKNRWELSPHYTINQGKPEIAREKPGPKAKHFLRIADIETFIGLLPNWDTLSVGLKAIVLSAAEEGCLGWHSPGIVAVCAWDEGLVTEWSHDFIIEHKPVLDRINVEIEIQDSAYPEIRWTADSIKAFQLMHVLLHELGHHHDRMTTASKSSSSRGEWFAENFANQEAEKLWDSYYRVFTY